MQLAIDCRICRPPTLALTPSIQSGNTRDTCYPARATGGYVKIGISEAEGRTLCSAPSPLVVNRRKTELLSHQIGCIKLATEKVAVAIDGPGIIAAGIVKPRRGLRPAICPHIGQR